MFLQTVRHVNVVVTNSKRKQKIVIGGILQILPLRAIHFVYVSVVRGNVVRFFPFDAAIDLGAEKYRFVAAICPHAPLGIRAGRHVGFQLIFTVFLVGRLYLVMLAFDDDVDVFLHMGLAFRENRQIHAFLGRTDLDGKFHGNSFRLVTQLLDQASLDVLSDVFFRSIVSNCSINEVTDFAVRQCRDESWVSHVLRLKLIVTLESVFWQFMIEMIPVRATIG